MRTSMLKLTTLTACLFILTLHSCKKKENETNDPNIVDKIINQTLTNDYDFFSPVESEGNTINLDVDGDGRKDVVFETFFEKPNEDMVMDTVINGVDIVVNDKDFGSGQIDGGDVLISGTAFFDYLPVLKKVSSGTEINTGLSTWQDGGFLYSKLFKSSGTINTIESGDAGTDQFIPFRFKSTSTNMHYGWILVNLSSDKKLLTVKEIAYHKTPNTPIVTGAK